MREMFFVALYFTEYMIMAQGKSSSGGNNKGGNSGPKGGGGGLKNAPSQNEGKESGKYRGNNPPKTK